MVASGVWNTPMGKKKVLQKMTKGDECGNSYQTWMQQARVIGCPFREWSLLAARPLAWAHVFACPVILDGNDFDMDGFVSGDLAG